METSAIDELYGDLGQRYQDSVLNYEEDSVDIYSGLEDSPKKNKDTGKGRTFLSPDRVKESLDLYEELITEEQKEKDANYNELKSKLIAAQNQVQDLLSKLQQMQTKNSSLHQENTLLKKNICALIKTAKMEIVRKDEEISKLSKRSSWKKGGQDSYSRSPALRESQGFKKDTGLSEVSQGRPLNQPGESSSVDSVASSSFVVPQRSSRSTPEDTDGPSSESLCKDNAEDRTGLTRVTRTSCSREGERESTITNSETGSRQNVCDEAEMSKRAGKETTPKEKDTEKSQCKPDKNRSDREQGESSKSGCGSADGPRQEHDGRVTLGRSGRSRSPSHPQHASSSAPASSRTPADMQSRKEEYLHKKGQEGHSRHTEVSGSRSEKSSSDKSHRKMEIRGTREHDRKEGMSSSERRHSRCDGMKEYDRRKTPNEEKTRHSEKNSSRGERRSTRSEPGKEHERQSAKESNSTRGMSNKEDKLRLGDGKSQSRSDSRERRRHASTVKPHHEDQGDKRRASGRTEESTRNKASSSKDASRCEAYMSSGRHRVKGRGDKEKQTGLPDKGLTNATDNARLPKTSEDGNTDVLEQRESSIRLTSSCDGSAMPEESSPKRKLSFMETLNLTLSPIKKPTVRHLTEDGSSVEVEEEFCVSDKLNNDSPPLPTNTNTQPSDQEPRARPEVNGKDLVSPKRLDSDLSETLSRDSQMPNAITDSGFTSVSQNCVLDKTAVPEISILPEPLLDSHSIVHLSDASCKVPDPEAPVRKDKERRTTGAQNSYEEVQIKRDAKAEVSAQNDTSRQEVATSVSTTATAKTYSKTDPSVSLEVVSSTVGVENSNKVAASDTEITQGLPNQEPGPGPLAVPSSEANNASTTAMAQEDVIPPELAISPEPDSTEMEISLPYQPVVVPHDEDSMMRTLSNIKVIPEAISPLTSPIRQIKKPQQQQHLTKEPHAKNLSKDFSTSATVANKDAVKMDMNKENKRPDPLVKPSVQKDQQESLATSNTEEGLEEGEILSESEGEGALVIQSPPNEKRSTLRNQPSPKSPRLQQNSQMQPAVTPNSKEQQKSTPSEESPSSNKRRFKTVTVPPKAKISTTAEFMNMLLFIRSELRRKYMKLHKNVTKPAFSCIVEMSQASFVEFVDSVNFQKFCSQGNEIKPLLNKIISSVMSKVSNNGIVNRIFEQRAGDLKQKLWNFVDGQFDFLFKELKVALKSASGLSKNRPSSKESNPRVKEDSNVDLCNLQSKEPLSTTDNRPHKKCEIETPAPSVQHNIATSNNLLRRGLGSSGKNIKATMEEGDKVPEVPSHNHPNQIQDVSSEKCLQEIVPAHESKTSNLSRRLSHSGSVQDRADFEILTEQQASSLTFNLVTDSQMGDIFRCLLQDSDLLESGDHQNWPLHTPRKEGQAGESLIGIMTPSKITPSKLITAWTSISPYKPTFQVPLHPALLDENCMLEVPSNAIQSVPVVAAVHSQSYSILAEDLAVSLTIPSPLKSDGHLSFLHPANNVQPLSTPSNVISAHYSEDALLGGEDATEHDIHLSLETDNSSSPSSASGNWEAPNPAAFQFKPSLPMQAEVMEKSNDHFIVRIRHTPPGGQEEYKHEEMLPVGEILSSGTLDQSLPMADNPRVTSDDGSDAAKTSKNGVLEGSGSTNVPETTGNLIERANEDNADAVRATATTESEHELTNTCLRLSRKRKKHHSGSKAKRCKRDKSQDKQEKQRHKKRSKSSKDKNEQTPSKKIKTASSPQLSPNSLSAKNVIRKKGEVVVTWTREEDRDILVAFKTKGASSKTFAALASKLRKSQSQIEERFTQLMKLFKKKEKMDS